MWFTKRFSAHHEKSAVELWCSSHYPKCHFICSSTLKTSIAIENEQTRKSSCEKLLSVVFDSKLTFQSHIHNICKKASQKLNAISRITRYVNFDKKRVAANAFFITQLNYCLLIWMGQNRTYKS